MSRPSSHTVGKVSTVDGSTLGVSSGTVVERMKRERNGTTPPVTDPCSVVICGTSDPDSGCSCRRWGQRVLTNPFRDIQGGTRFHGTTSYLSALSHPVLLVEDPDPRHRSVLHQVPPGLPVPSPRPHRHPHDPWTGGGGRRQPPRCCFRDK